jgi:hypothetical protein
LGSCGSTLRPVLCLPRRGSSSHAEPAKLDTVTEIEADMDGVLQRFDVDLLLDGHGHGDDSLCEERRSSSSIRLSDRWLLMAVSVGGSVCVRAGGSERRSASGGGAQDKAGIDGAVKERIARALRIYKDAAGLDGGALVQVWAPARDGGRRVLATRGQPFVLPPPRCHRLFQYRTVSLAHAFPVGGAAVPGERGLPGRVFDAGEPEWTPNVQYYGTGEYARISYALIYDIQAALALPILDPATGACLAVLELVTTSPRLHFAAEVDRLSEALQVPPLLQLFRLPS